MPALRRGERGGQGAFGDAVKCVALKAVYSSLYTEKCLPTVHCSVAIQWDVKVQDTTDEEKLRRSHGGRSPAPACVDKAT